MKVFCTNYHISVNRTLMNDLVAIGLELIMPSGDFARNPESHISFFAPNDEHGKIAKIVHWDEFRRMGPMIILVPCTQLVEDFLKIYRARGEVDELVLLTANSDHEPAWRMVPTKFILSHDLTYHRKFPGYKTLYFSRPTILRDKKTGPELQKSFEERKIKLYINNLEGERNDGLKPEYEVVDVEPDCGGR